MELPDADETGRGGFCPPMIFYASGNICYILNFSQHFFFVIIIQFPHLHNYISIVYILAVQLSHMLACLFVISLTNTTGRFVGSTSIERSPCLCLEVMTTPSKFGTTRCAGKMLNRCNAQLSRMKPTTPCSLVLTVNIQESEL